MGTTHEETRYTCNQCKYNSTQETNLKKHIETTHDETRYTCNCNCFESNPSSGLENILRFYFKIFCTLNKSFKHKISNKLY